MCLLRFSSAAVLLLLVWIGSAHAHSPGFSRVELRQMNDRLHATAVFSAAEVGALLNLVDGEGRVRPEAFADARARARHFAEGILRIGSGGQTLAGRELNLALVATDLRIHMTFDVEPGTEIDVAAPALSQLPFGHRQHVALRDEANRLLDQRMLTAGSAVRLQLDRRAHSTSGFGGYVVQGAHHIWIGFDHILFLLTLLLPSVLVYAGAGRWRSVAVAGPAMIDLAKTVTAFTLAHSLTLTLAVLELVVLPQRLVESAIALSVIAACANNLYPVFRGSRWSLAFVFGLIHGFGFAAVLVDLGLDAQGLAASLLGFNLGVELGQLAIVALAFPVSYALRHTIVYRKYVFRGGSIAAATVAGVWLLERSLEVSIL